MIVKFSVIGFYFFLTLSCYSQQGLSELLPKNGKSIQSFVPAGWIQLDSVSGDFNKDGIKDIALVIVDSVLEKLADVNRSVVILQGTTHGFRLSGIGDSAILCLGCGGVFGDPYAGIEFKGNTLWITHYGGSSWKWSYIDKFQFRKGKWYLIGETSHSFWVLERCESLNEFAGTIYKDTNFLTGEFEEKEITEGCKLVKDKKGKRKVEPLITLDKFIVIN